MTNNIINIKMNGYLAIDIEKATKRNKHFRNVISTSKFHQIALMNILPGDSLGMEVHKDNDQFLRFEAGTGETVINGIRYPVFPGTAFDIPAGVQHNFINTGKENLKLYTIYSPPHHPHGLIQHMKPKDSQHYSQHYKLTLKLLALKDGDHININLSKYTDKIKYIIQHLFLEDSFKVTNISIDNNIAIIDIDVYNIPSDNETIEEFFNDYFGDMAADTWMEGDIELDEQLEIELDLELISIRK